jgi:vitamin K-dependent gamma-carboxylase
MSDFSLRTLQKNLLAPVDAASLAVFRIGFGLIMAWEMYCFLSEGKVDYYFVEPVFHFKYLGFAWLQPWPRLWMYGHFYALLALALCLAAGLFYRLSALLFALGYTYVFLLDQAQYQNHYYLICLLSFLLVSVPAHRTLSLDRLLFAHPHIASVPAWSLWLLRAQMGLVYFYGGIAKLNVDWLTGWPMRQWLVDAIYLPPFTHLFDTMAAAYFFSYAGLLIDLAAFPLLVRQRTRPYMLVVLFLFHFVNSQLFSIGAFPYLGVALTLLFLPADWPRRLFNWPTAPPAHEDSTTTLNPKNARLMLVLLTTYLAIQALLPLRHWLYPGNVSWTEEGHRFAWHMKLRDKECSASFFLYEPTSGDRWQVNRRKYLTDRQSDKMANRPYMAVQFAHFLAARERRPGDGPIEVRAHISCSLNGRPYFPIVDPDLDLAQVHYGMAAADWILPLPPARAGAMYPP